MKTGRNDPCPCGSNKKYKNCCLDKQAANTVTQKLMWVVLVLVAAVSLVLIVVSIRSHDSTSQGGTGRVWSDEHQHWHRSP